ncbi:MAG: Wadjet anti-phage system protein JetD domain-containing protein [Promethearchaeota archaeon]
MSKDYLEFYEQLVTLSKNKVTITKETILKIFEKLYPGLYFSNENFNPQLIEILKKLKEENLIEFPKTNNNWDYNMRPPLPLWIKLIKEEEEKISDDLKNFPWHPHMVWVSKLDNVKKSTYKSLRQINTFFINHELNKNELIPIKERSIQIFQDEKKLDIIIRQDWFKNHLTLEDLGCYQTCEPFASKSFPNARDKKAIIIENRDTFHSFCRVNENLDPPPYRYIIYGCGKFIEKTILWVNDFDSSLTEIEYFGDLDPMGLIIPQNLNNILKENAINVKIKLATPFYLELVHIAKRIFNNLKKDDLEENKLLEFLPRKARKFSNFIFSNNKRIAQELLGLNKIEHIIQKEI